MTRATLTVADLQSQREARARVNHETYKQLLAQVQDRIRMRANNDFRDLLWQVPPLVPGRPVFTASHAARYISEKLRRGGFDVTVAAPGDDLFVLYITWQPAPPPRSGAGKQRRDHGDARRNDTRGNTRSRELPISVAEATHRLEKLKARLKL